MSDAHKLFCLTCGTAGTPRQPAGVISRNGGKIALAATTALLVWKFQPQMWWIAAFSILPVLFDILFAGPAAPQCTVCASAAMIPVDSPRAQQKLREQERAADRVIAEHDAKERE